MQPTACPELVEGAQAVGELNKDASNPRKGERKFHVEELHRSFSRANNALLQDDKSKCLL